MGEPPRFDRAKLLRGNHFHCALRARRPLDGLRCRSLTARLAAPPRNELTGRFPTHNRQRMRASGKTTKYGSLKALHKKWTNLQGQSELSKEDLVLVVGYKLTRGKMRPLMRFAEAMHDNEVRKASKAAIAAIPDARKACDALTALTGIGVATASVCLAAVDDRLPVMSDEALEAVLGEPEHSKKYDLDSYQRLLEACSAKAKKLGGLWTPRAVEEALFSASLEQPAAKRKRGD